MSRSFTFRSVFVFFFCLVSFFVLSQINLGYQKPHGDILELVDAPLPPQVRMNSNSDKAILQYRNSYSSIQALSEPEMRLAGLRINPAKLVSSRLRYYHKISLLDVKKGMESDIQHLPEDGLFAYIQFSPDESMISFTNTSPDGVELWIIDVQLKEARKLGELHLNASMGVPYSWSKTSKELLLKIRIPDLQIIENVNSIIPEGPTISESSGQKAQNRTYQDLLKNNVDEYNFESLVTSEIVKINLNGEITTWKDAAMYQSIDFSPDGNFVLIKTIHRPFSYLVPYRRFPSKSKVYTKNGIPVKTVVEDGLLEELPKGFMAVKTGRRNINWRNDQPATLYWIEALDEGNPANEVDYRDQIMIQSAPFTGPVMPVFKTQNRFSRVIWGNDQIAVASDRWWNTRNTKSYLFNPEKTDDQGILLVDRNYQDNYNDPGNYVTEKNNFGESVLLIQENNLYLVGNGHSEDGPRAFLDELNTNQLKKKRLWRADGKSTLEKIIDVIDIQKGDILTSIESQSKFPNYYFRNINKNQSPVAITHFKNPFSSIANVHKEVISYPREDGLNLSATLYLPSDYNKQSVEKLPMLMWAYPREFKDIKTASQRTRSPHQFSYPSYGSPIFWVARGYAVLEGAAFPIVGIDEDEPNDRFVEQLVANAKAAIDAVDNMGYIDRDRVGVGGHSYGAFMTANLLSHSNLFAAGIARSGAYNRTLTPFGFQAEERTYWEAPEIYYNMSPFMHADKMKTPLLLIHGEADNNSGTYPIQSQRYFNALKGLGARVRLVMLPKESHGYSAKESIYHMLWEQDNWLEKHVKNKQKPGPARPE